MKEILCSQANVQASNPLLLLTWWASPPKGGGTALAFATVGDICEAFTRFTCNFIMLKKCVMS